MYNLQDGAGGFSPIFSITGVLLGTFIVTPLFIAVLIQNFLIASEASELEHVCSPAGRRDDQGEPGGGAASKLRLAPAPPSPEKRFHAVINAAVREGGATMQ